MPRGIESELATSESHRRTGTGGLRVALYSHDALGIGHVRRNLLIARTLAAPEVSAQVLLIAGTYEAGCFAMPPGVDCVALPAVEKRGGNGYAARRLDVPLDELVALRSAAIASVLESFAPDVLIVDKVPRGGLGELNRALRTLRQRRGTTCVLGLREILDDPQTIRAEWQRERYDDAVAEYYDAIWIYGDPRVYDAVEEYAFSPQVAAKVRYTGYLAPWPAGPLEDANGDGWAVEPAIPMRDGRMALCVVGGGQDGGLLARCFCQSRLPADMYGVLIAGPFMPSDVRRELYHLASGNPRLQILDFVSAPEQLIARADCVVAMGGYNTVCELVAAGKRALIVPRIAPRREQLIRAERLRDLGYVDAVHPDEFTSQTLERWLSARAASPPPPVGGIDFGGRQRLPQFLSELLAAGAADPCAVASAALPVHHTAPAHEELSIVSG